MGAMPNSTSNSSLRLEIQREKRTTNFWESITSWKQNQSRGMTMSKKRYAMASLGMVCRRSLTIKYIWLKFGVSLKVK